MISVNKWLSNFNIILCSSSELQINQFQDMRMPSSGEEYDEDDNNENDER